MDFNTGVTLMLAGVGGVAWLVRLEGTQKAHEAKDAAIQEQLKDSIQRVERQVDKLVEHLIERK